MKTEILREVRERRASLQDAVAPERLAAVVRLVDGGTVSASAAKTVLAAMWDDPSEPLAIAERLGLLQIGDESLTSEWVDEILAANPAQAAEYRAGKTQLLGFFVGQIMRRSGGRANPQTVQSLTRQALEPRAALASRLFSRPAP